MTTLNPLKFYLVPMRPEIAFEATVSATPTDPYMSISFSSATATGTAPPLAGMTAYFEASDGTARGDVRVRSIPTGTASGTLSVAENDDVTPFVQSGDTVRIYNEFRLWPIYPRFTQDGTNVTQYEDYDIAYSSQLTNYIPTAVAGPPGAAFLSGGQAQVSFVGDRSFTVDPSASISTYYWRAYGSVEADSSSQGTEASPVTFTWTSDGVYLVSLTVTDSNGKSHTSYTYVAIIDPNNANNVAFTNFDATGEKFDFTQGGGECSFTIREADVSPAQFPDEMAILHIIEGNLTTPTASWPNRSNLLFWGWIMGDSVRQSPDSGEVAFRAGTIDRVMRNLSQFPVSLTNNSNPVAWTQAKNLTVDRVCHYVYNYRSTLALMTPIRPLNYSGLIGRQDFGNQDLYSAVQSGLMQSIWGYLTASPQGVLYHQIDYNLQNSTERSAATTRKTLHKGIWAGDVGIEEIHDYSWMANQVKMSGIAYTGGDYDDVCPMFSEAPGDAPKAWGREANVDRLILISQSDLNVRCGHKLAQLNNEYPAVRASFFNDGAFTNVPQDLFPLVIEAGDNDRQIAISQNALARSIGRQYDHKNGLIQVDVTFELVTTGNPGVTVDMPCEPPPQDLPPKMQTNLVPAGGGSSGFDALSAISIATTGSSWYIAGGVPAPWEQRVNGLSTAQQRMLDMVRDPFSAVINGGYNPENSVVWGCGSGFIARSENSGREWRIRSNNVPDAEYPGDSAVSATDIDFIAIAPNDFSKNHLYFLGRWQSGGNWRGGILQTTDGFNYTWTYLTGNSQVMPLGMAIDRGYGTRLWVTTWESDDKIYLRRLELTAVNQSLKVDLGSATEAEINAETYRAYPSCAYGHADQIFVFGRMQDPQSLGDPSHIIKSENLGSSWAVVESGWGDDLCEAFASDQNNYYYAVRYDATPGWTAYTSNIITGFGRIVTDGFNLYYRNGTSNTLNIFIYKFDGRTKTESIVLNGSTLANFSGLYGIAWFQGALYVIINYSDGGGTLRIQKWNGAENSFTTVYDDVVGVGQLATRLYTNGSVLVAAFLSTDGAPQYTKVYYSDDGTTWNEGSFEDDTPYYTNAGAIPKPFVRVTYYPLGFYDTFYEVGYSANIIKLYKWNSDTATFEKINDSAVQHYDSTAPNGVHLRNSYRYDLAMTTETEIDANIDRTIMHGFRFGVGAQYISVTGTAFYKLLGAGTSWDSDMLDLINGNDLTSAGVQAVTFIHTGQTRYACAYNATSGDYEVWERGANTNFYTGSGALSARFGLPFERVKPGAMSLNKAQGRVVIGGLSDSIYPVVYSDYPYLSSAPAIDGALNSITGTFPISSVKWL